MRIAAVYEDGEIVEQFGRAKQLKFYDIEEGKRVAERILDLDGSGPRAIVEFLAANEVDAVICDGIGGSVRELLADEGIAVYGDVEDSADAAVEALLEGKLQFE